VPNYTLSDVRAIHDLPLPDLLLRAQQVHREHHRPNEVQLCSLAVGEDRRLP
jgi:biotin synthase